MSANLLTAVTLVFSALAAGVLVWYLARKPPLIRSTVVSMLAGLGLFPIAAAVSGNYRGFEATKEVEFCSSCHVMAPWIADARNKEGETLASFHSRNELFGKESCYACHADYGMYGTVMTKVEGTRHLVKYYTEYRNAGDAQIAGIALYQPFRNQTCMHCHSTMLPGWNDEPEHQAVVDDVRSGATSCASEGCHGPAHGKNHVKAETPVETQGEGS